MFRPPVLPPMAAMEPRPFFRLCFLGAGAAASRGEYIFPEGEKAYERYASQRRGGNYPPGHQRRDPRQRRGKSAEGPPLSGKGLLGGGRESGLENGPSRRRGAGRYPDGGRSRDQVRPRGAPHFKGRLLRRRPPRSRWAGRGGDPGGAGFNAEFAAVGYRAVSAFRRRQRAV